MASRKYAYYVQGNKIALVQVNDASDAVTTSEYGKYKSPIETIADGLELQYTYVPNYRIDETEDKNTALDTYISLDGLLKVLDTGSNNYSTSPESLSDGSYVVLDKAGRWNGLHKVKDSGAGSITFYTPYSGDGTTAVAFEETPDLYYNVSAMVDESFDLDLPHNLSLAVVSYLKAKMMEDVGEIERKEYFMRQFRKLVEKHNSARSRGPFVIQGFSEIIR